MDSRLFNLLLTDIPVKGIRVLYTIIGDLLEWISVTTMLMLLH